MVERPGIGGTGFLRIERIRFGGERAMPGHVDDEDEVIIPAREGTLRVLSAARAAGVGRVVLTSAFHAVSWGHPHTDHVFTEADWTVLDGPVFNASASDRTAKFFLVLLVAYTLISLGVKRYRSVRPTPSQHLLA